MESSSPVNHSQHIGNKYNWPEFSQVVVDPQFAQTNKQKQQHQPSIQQNQNDQERHPPESQKSNLPSCEWTDGIQYPHQIKNLEPGQTVRVKWPLPQDGKQEIIVSNVASNTSILAKILEFLGCSRNDSKHQIVEQNFNVNPNNVRTWVEADFTFAADAADDPNRSVQIYVVSVREANIDFKMSEIELKINARSFHQPQQTELGFFKFRDAGYHQFELIENYYEVVHSKLQLPQL